MFKITFAAALFAAAINATEVEVEAEKHAYRAPRKEYYCDVDGLKH